MTEQLTEDQWHELRPLAQVIDQAIRATPVRIGDPIDLTGAIAVAVAAYLGREVLPTEPERAELARLRAELEALRRRSARAEATIERMKRTNRMVNGGARESRERAERAMAELAALREQVAARDADQTAAVAAARAAGYRLAADNAAEQRQLHGPDADAEMLVHFLQRGAELHQRFAADHPEQYAASRPSA